MVKIIKKKIRLIIFFLIFIIISPLIVLYANGDIFNDGWNILKTGGVYINGAPNNSKIFINSKLKEETTFFERDILIKNFRADVYRIDVKKEGYNTWSKDVTVLNNMVSDANVFMLPQNIEFRDIFLKIDSEKKVGTTTLIIKKDNPEYSKIFKLFVVSTTTKLDLSTTNILGTKESPIVNGKINLWNKDKKIFISWTGKIDSAPKYFCDNGVCSSVLEVINLKSDLTSLDFLPGYDGVIVVSSNSKVFAVQVENNPLKDIQIIYEGNSPTFKIFNGLLYVKDGNVLREYSL
jgi:hypothetical protein